MNRRAFLTAILALGTAPAIVRASSLMPVRRIWVPDDAIIYPNGVWFLNGSGLIFVGERKDRLVGVSSQQAYEFLKMMTT